MTLGVIRLKIGDTVSSEGKLSPLGERHNPGQEGRGCGFCTYLSGSTIIP